MTALIWASREGSTDIVSLLLSKGASPAIRDSVSYYYFTPSEVHCSIGWLDLCHHISRSLIFVLSYLFVLSPSQYGRSALAWAAKEGHSDIVALLLAKCTDDNNNTLHSSDENGAANIAPASNDAINIPDNVSRWKSLQSVILIIYTSF
jgi:ankyrin repeat protein